jgi:UDP-N-acetylglucosamine 2-epimerase (non-hydrolysing)
MMSILHVVGARPNFMKAAAVIRALTLHGVKQFLVHTGQHYDSSMSDVFFRQLELPEPDLNLGVGSGTHAQQTAEVMLRFEPAVKEYKPDLVLVYGDVNSTLAAALVCSKLKVAIGHVEAGLRSCDRTMPEEINRVLTDQISEFLFTPSADAQCNLDREGVAASKIYHVGNVMIDTLVRLLPHTHLAELPKLPDRYALLTLHRPSNVDDGCWLRKLLFTLHGLDIPVIFPVHPRTRASIAELGIELPGGRMRLLEPLPYLEFVALQQRAALVITDSGGIQEETSFLRIPCLTVRENTERPITVSLGSNVLVGRNLIRLRTEIDNILKGKAKQARSIPLWDGHAADRIAEILAGRAMAASA